jgi:hypothetical protein
MNQLLMMLRSNLSKFKSAAISVPLMKKIQICAIIEQIKSFVKLFEIVKAPYFAGVGSQDKLRVEPTLHW